MGCCSSTERSTPSSQTHKQQNSRSDSVRESRAPPPSAEEETVKEVLSVTPKPPPPPAKINDKVKEEEAEVGKKIWVKEEEEVSEASEIYSSSVSAAITDKREDDEDEVRQRISRSPAKSAPRNQHSGDLGPKRGRGVNGSSSTRRPEHSPAKRNGAINGASVRMVQSGSREVGRGSRPDPTRKDPGESSGRRTGRVAAAAGGNRPNPSRSPSTRKTGPSPGRVRVDPAGNKGGRKAEENLGRPNESLENPLVSLECFIFL